MSENIAEEIRAFFWKNRIPNPVNVTFTEKKIVSGQWIDDAISEQNMRHFRNKLNQQVYGNGYKRFGKGLCMIVIRESDNKRHHLHLIIEQPSRYDFQTFSNLIHELWTSTRFGYKYIHIEKPSSKIREDSWLDYILKNRTKTCFETSIDWNNTYVPSL